MLEGDADSQGESVPVGTVKLKSETGQRDVMLVPKPPATAVFCRTDLGYWEAPVTTANKNPGCLPGWCGSVDWASSHELKGHWLDSHSGHITRLKV